MVVELVRSLPIPPQGAHHLDVMNPSFMISVRHEGLPVDRAEELRDFGRQPRPALAVVTPVLRVGERQMLHKVRHIGHPRVQILIPATCEQLQMPWDTWDHQPALRVAAALEGLVICRPPVALHLHCPLDPAHDLGLVAPALVEGEAAVRLVEAKRREGIDAFLPAQHFKVHAIHLDQPHAPLHAVPVRELQRALSVVPVDLLRQLGPMRGERHAVAAPTREEVDEGEVVRLYDMLEVAVFEAIMGARPIRVQFRLPILLQPHLLPTLVLAFTSDLLLRGLLRLDRHPEGPPLGVYRAEPEVLGRDAQALLARLGIDNDLEVSTLDVV
mmetsp:Transcript_83792/g.211334  ORF Transcript_83792/g.211334 Transcript_83792/m.211334 type:complete len:328 (+) Transcript_83792:380-1363(+)